MQKVLIALLALSASSSALAADAALLVYKVWEQGAEPYITRMLITDAHVRLDEGQDQADYTLFDRDAGIIYNVSFEDQSVLVIEPELEQLPAASGLIFSENDAEDAVAPLVGGVRPHNVELLANGESCSKLVTLPGLMEPALKGLREFKQVLARVQAAGLAARPEQLQTPCDLAMNVHAATRTVDFGLPIREQSEGRAQALLDYAAVHAVDDALFRVPEDFNRQVMPQLPAL